MTQSPEQPPAATNRSWKERLGLFVRNQSGATAMMFAVSLPAGLGAIGVASDFAIYNMKLAKLQAAADQAAIAGAKEFALSTSTTSSINNAAKTFAEASYDPGAALNVAISVDGKKASVKVNLTENWSPFFAHFVGAHITPVVADSTAALSGQANVCILALNKTLPYMVMVDKGGRVTANSCGVNSNSKSPAGISVQTAGVIKAEVTCSAGGVVNGGTITPPPTTDCPTVDDPLGSRPAPPIGGCLFTNFKATSGTTTLNPGTYCGGISLSGTAKAIFNPGTYVIKDGDFKVSGNAAIQGDHVGFYLTGTTSKLNFTGDSTVSLTGAVTGEMSGLLFYEDRTAPLYRTHRINSKSANQLTGTIYLPRGYLLVDPSSKIADQSAYTAIIAQGVMVTAGPELVMNSNYGATDVPVPVGIKAESKVVLLQ